MDPHDEHGRPAIPDRPADPVAERFGAIVSALAREDPRFARRVSAPAPGRMGAGNLALVLGLVATVLLGAVPLVLGLHLGSVVLCVVGAVGCLLLPVGVPLLLRTVLYRVRPLRR
ncbi:DUF3040 domain-containing protein [Actinomycetospora sp. C-140]